MEHREICFFFVLYLPTNLVDHPSVAGRFIAVVAADCCVGSIIGPGALASKLVENVRRLENVLVKAACLPSPSRSLLGLAAVCRLCLASFVLSLF